MKFPTKRKFNKFYAKSYNERLHILNKLGYLNPDLTQEFLSYKKTVFPLIENYLTDYPLEEGLVVNLNVNGKNYIVPFVTEEPSVIAAACNGANLLSNSINAEVSKSYLTGQIVIENVTNDPDFFKTMQDFVLKNKNKLKTIGNKAHPSVTKHGKGVLELVVRAINNQYVSIDVMVDVGEAMGANTINSILEGLAEFFSKKLNIKVLMSILTNGSNNFITKVTGKVPVSDLKTKSLSGRKVAEQIVKASVIGQLDPQRAVTHNKGIMNGIDALLVATGNDWRGVEAAVHAYAARSGQYQGLSKWKLVGNNLVGELEIPLPLGIVGGATHNLPVAALNHQLLKVKSADELRKVTAAVGLSQNLAALKALVTTGIQAGHMKLRLKSLFQQVGVANSKQAALTKYLQARKPLSAVTQEDVKAALKYI